MHARPTFFARTFDAVNGAEILLLLLFFMVKHTEYRIVLNTMSHYIHIMRTETRIIQEVVLYLRSHYIPSPHFHPINF